MTRIQTQQMVIQQGRPWYREKGVRCDVRRLMQEKRKRGAPLAIEGLLHLATAPVANKSVLEAEIHGYETSTYIVE